MKQKYLLPFAIAISLATLMFPDIVLANIGGGGDSINNVLNKILSLMTGNVAKTLTVIAIAGSGYLAYIGQLPWKAMINIAIGAGIIFGASSIGTMFYGSV